MYQHQTNLYFFINQKETYKIYKTYNNKNQLKNIKNLVWKQNISLQSLTLCLQIIKSKLKRKFKFATFSKEKKNESI